MPEMEPEQEVFVPEDFRPADSQPKLAVLLSTGIRWVRQLAAIECIPVCVGVALTHWLLPLQCGVCPSALEEGAHTAAQGEGCRCGHSSVWCVPYARS